MASNNLLHAVTYPDGGTVVYEYNRQGQRIQLTDQNATIHQYDYDLLGRQTTDRVSQVGLGINGAVRCIGLGYEVRGMVKNVTSYSTPAVDEDFIVNEVRNDYRDFMQNAGQDQEHNGKVVLGTTLRTIYDYIDGTGNTARFWRYSLPDELGTFSYNYGDADGIGDRLSRPIGTTAQYSLLYLGLATMVENRRYHGQLILWSLLLGSNAANPYGGLDRFGRVIDNKWTAPDISTTLDRIQYGYDRVGNRVWRYNVVAHTHSAAFDEPYSYDGLNQLTDMQRGSYSTAPTPPSTPPSGFSSTPTLQQTWSLDSTGNWTDFTEALSGSTTLDQTRKANRVNEITEITNSTGGDWQQPVYDAAGNMTLMPQPASPGDGFAAVYDAWNRLVRIDDVSGESPVTVQENAYDGLTRRVSKTTFGESGEIRHYYYDIDWRVIEEYVGATPNRSNREDWDRIYAWGLRYIDELALRLRAVEGEDPEALVALQDANWNVTAICDGTAAVVERYAYTAYGTPTFQDDTFAPLSSNESAYNWETLHAGYRYDEETGFCLARFRVLNATIGRWLTRDPVEYSSLSYNLYLFLNSSPWRYFDPFGLDWHHLLPAQYAEIFEKLGFDIDSKEFGWDIASEYHTGNGGIHPLGWNNDWGEFLKGNKNLTKSDVLKQLEVMKASSKYKDILAKGVPVKKNYPYQWFRKNQAKFPSGKGGALKMLGAFAVIIQFGQFASAACGECDPDVQKLEAALRKLARTQKTEDCQEAFSALHAFLKCVGYSDIPNNIELQRSYLDTCTQFK